MAAREAVFVLGLILCLAAAALVRTVYFEGVVPAGDEHALIAWSQEVHGADHVLPRPAPGQDWLAALGADRDSALGRIYARIGQAPQDLSLIHI